jgi:hypothetical protein
VDRALTNQEAFDIAVLHLLNQGQRCFNASGMSRYRGTRGKNAIGALIPDELYTPAMEGRTIQQILGGGSPEYPRLREYLGGVPAPLLKELQDLHDRMGECLPSMFRDLVVAGCNPIARAFGLSARMAHLWLAYQRLPGPHLARIASSEPAGRTSSIAA